MMLINLKEKGFLRDRKRQQLLLLDVGTRLHNAWKQEEKKTDLLKKDGTKIFAFTQNIESQVECYPTLTIITKKKREEKKAE